MGGSGGKNRAEGVTLHAFRECNQTLPMPLVDRQSALRAALTPSPISAPRKLPSSAAASAAVPGIHSSAPFGAELSEDDRAPKDGRAEVAAGLVLADCARRNDPAVGSRLGATPRHEA